jgi:hypothetical protein
MVGRLNVDEKLPWKSLRTRVALKLLKTFERLLRELPIFFLFSLAPFKSQVRLNISALSAKLVSLPDLNLNPHQFTFQHVFC